LLEPPVNALGYELVDVQVRTGGKGLLRLFIDQEAGINLSDCELVSQQLSAFLDIEDPLPVSYVLEVSSPGQDRPLRTLAHFQRFRDERAKIELKESRDGRRGLTGRLLGTDDQEVLIDVDGEIWRVALAEIAAAKLVRVY